MSFAKTVQYKSKESVIQAYKMRDVAPFAVFSGKQFLYSCIPEDVETGATNLEAYLDLLEDGQSAGIYTLTVYDDLQPGDKIKNNTPYDGSFNFRFLDQPLGYIGNGPAYINEMRTERLKLEKRIAELEAKQEGNGEDANGIGAILNSPLMEIILPHLAPLISGIVGKLTNGLGLNDGQPGRQLEEVPESSQLGAIPEIEPGTKIREALAVLVEKAPDLPDLLAKLARIAVSKPIQFKTYLIMLRSMKG